MELKNLAKYRRYLWKDPNLLVVLGEIGPVMAGYEEYNGRYGIEIPKPQVVAALERIFAAVGLAAVWLADRESWGWSINLPGSDMGFFVGVEPEGMICGRIHEADSIGQSVVVQRQKASQPVTQSHFELQDGDPVHMVQRYFETVEQSHTRLVVAKDGRSVLAHELPGGRLGEVESLTEDQLVDITYQMAGRGELKPVGEVLLFYECRCHDEMILKMIEEFPPARQKEIWGDLHELDIECPRCGRGYVVKKKAPAK